MAPPLRLEGREGRGHARLLQQVLRGALEAHLGALGVGVALALGQGLGHRGQPLANPGEGGGVGGGGGGEKKEEQEELKKEEEEKEE